MSLKIKKEELELMSNKDIAVLILENSKRTINTADLYKKIMNDVNSPVDSSELPEKEGYSIKNFPLFLSYCFLSYIVNPIEE